ncbi:hypothetical protein STEG23_005567, partial [Scotinomys teguina]
MTDTCGLTALAEAAFCLYSAGAVGLLESDRSSALVTPFGENVDLRNVAYKEYLGYGHHWGQPVECNQYPMAPTAPLARAALLTLGTESEEIQYTQFFVYWLIPIIG